MNLAKILEFLNKHLKAVVRLSLLVLVLLLALDLVPDLINKHHAHTKAEHIPGFWAAFGFFGCLLVFVFSKTYGHLGISKNEDYYGD